MRINEKMDAGNILYQETMAVDSRDNAYTLSERLSKRSAEILPGFSRQSSHRMAWRKDWSRTTIRQRSHRF